MKEHSALYALLLCLALLSIAEAQHGAHQRRNSKAVSFIDYFFPNSRNAKVSATFPKSEEPKSSSTSAAPSTTETTTSAKPISTIGSSAKVTASSATTPSITTTSEARATGSVKSTTAAKKKAASSRVPGTSTKTKISQKASLATRPMETATSRVTLAASSSSSATARPATPVAAPAPALTREGDLALPDGDKPEDKESAALAGPASVLAKPTKYHYYPHNQHIYLLPECAIQQVCNAVYVRLNYTQPLCACPARHRDPCSASLNTDDLHTTQLAAQQGKKYAHKAVTLVKTCEATSEMRVCRAPRDWSLLALQNIRTGKSHYLVICRCPQHHQLEGPMSHDQPTYASVPGIRVYGMMCVQQQDDFSSPDYSGVTGRPSTSNYGHARSRRHTSAGALAFPWEQARELALSADWN